MFQFLQASTSDMSLPSMDSLSKIKDMALEYAPKLVGAVLVYIIGSWIISKISSVMRNAMGKRQYDASLQTFLASLVKISLNVLLLLTIFGMIGVNLTAFGALLAGLGLAIGGALNGSLGNFAGGIMMLIFKPFKVGDMIEAQGQTGVVKELGIFNTILLSAENKTIILANGAVSTGTIINYTAHGNLRVDITMAIAPDQNIDQAKKIAIDAMLSNPKVLQSPAPEVNVLKVGDGMITFAIRPFAVQGDYWDVFFGCQELIKKAWDANGIQGPIPHMVHINK
jgi:small conductance mechanosensitive channel